MFSFIILLENSWPATETTLPDTGLLSFAQRHPRLHHGVLYRFEAQHVRRRKRPHSCVLWLLGTSYQPLQSRYDDLASLSSHSNGVKKASVLSRQSRELLGTFWFKCFSNLSMAFFLFSIFFFLLSSYSCILFHGVYCCSKGGGWWDLTVMHWFEFSLNVSKYFLVSLCTICTFLAIDLTSHFLLQSGSWLQSQWPNTIWSQEHEAAWRRSYSLYI